MLMQDDKPDALTKAEYEFEMAERRAKKNNLFLRKVRTCRPGWRVEVKNMIQEITGDQRGISKITPPK